ncbi:HesB/IscA family protein [Thermocoleostomius sinensis]|jgi:iron-sulfur cluster assembly protein|uniref:Iron-sulfur cluster assembly accessory protein n=1 Tax=Thermocoleostomius sinensis A174 TaxID=2016057 RepID=A0A9E9CA30_9CYAN|nr:iron-sulfur cluster assembly accessory protein [Thermocoleostomius sinensis]WAL58430.1 iron-sulfur cluster assembly accessory protein [Thermocoleostomius sinensis A174]
MTIILTEVAELRLRTFLQATGKSENLAQGIRISVEDGGCSGYQYALNLVYVPKPGDLQVQQGRVSVYVDPDSAPLLDGVVVDYVEGLTQSGFKFTNPNATDTCGCGQSFRTGDCTPTGVPCS